MVRQRLQNHSLLQLVLPAILIVISAALAILGGRQEGTGPREGLFDLYQRIHARPISETGVDVAIVDIDKASIERVGPWPWPRTALAGLVTAAKDAGAAAIVVTVPVDGQDPLSPEVASRYWARSDADGEVSRALEQLPTNNAALAASAVDFPVSLGVGRPAPRQLAWVRADVLASGWAQLATEGATGFLALPDASPVETIDPGLRETSLISVVGLPEDQDGIHRRTPLLWTIEGAPQPTAGLAGLVLPGLAGRDVEVRTSKRMLFAGGPPPVALRWNSANDEGIYLGGNGNVRQWFPKDLSLTTVPAWRALEGGAAWTGPLGGKVVFIGQSLNSEGHVMTARGEMTLASAHAHLAQQLADKAIPHRPSWIGLAEAVSALMIGIIMLGLALLAKPILTFIASIGTAIAAAITGLMVWQQSLFLTDPLPTMIVALGVPLLVLAVHVANMLRGGEAARAAFHGALPQGAVRKLQSKGAGFVMTGTWRAVTVLSCGVKLPDHVAAEYEDRPADYIELTGAINDTLRKTILNNGGTVDYGEDGRLLGYWNAPEMVADPIERACSCALKMVEEMNRMADDLVSAAQTGAVGGQALAASFADGSLEVGIATTPCFAGPVGRGTHNRYSVVGPAVGLATALRRRASLYGPAIITDDVVFDVLRHQYAFLDLDVVQSSTDAPVRTIYGLSGNSFLKASKAFRQLADTQRELVASWRQEDLATTARQLQRLRGIPGVPDAYIELFDDRLTSRNAPAETKPPTAVQLGL